MRNTIVLAIFLLLQQMVVAQMPKGFSVTTKIYLVRHAEKQSGTDPALTEKGYKRAGALLQTLKHKHLHHIYVTQYKRTQMTGDSLRIQLSIDTVHYAADTTGEDVYNKIIANNEAGKTILIIGHSNTIPKIIKKLGATDYNTSTIPDAEYDNLYLITYKKRKPVVKQVKYGAASSTAAAMQ